MGTAVVDLDIDLSAVVEIGHRHQAAQREVPVRRGQGELVERLAARRLLALEAGSIPGCQVALDPLERFGTAGETRHRGQQHKNARDEGACAVTRVAVTLGAYAHISPEHFREHFEQGARDTLAATARLEITQSTDTTDPRAQEIILDAIDVQ